MNHKTIKPCTDILLTIWDSNVLLTATYAQQFIYVSDCMCVRVCVGVWVGGGMAGWVGNEEN